MTSLVTNGYICYRGQLVLAPASLDTPDIVGVVEVRPKIRRITPPDEVGQPKPAVIVAQELKPAVTGHITPVSSPTLPPKTRTAQELKPEIVKAEEE